MEIDCGHLWSVELNMKEDPLCIGSWHIDSLDKTLKSNLKNSITRKVEARWVILGICDSLDSAHELADSLILHIKDKRLYLGLDDKNRVVYSLEDKFTGIANSGDFK